MSCILQEETLGTNFQSKETRLACQQKVNKKWQIKIQKIIIEKKDIASSNISKFINAQPKSGQNLSACLKNKKEYEKFSSTISLRGGGCGASKSEKLSKPEQISQRKLPENFLSDLQSNLNVIVSLASVASEDQQKEEIMIAIQWFAIMREHINTLCFDTKTAAAAYDSIFEILPQILKSAVTYLRISGLLCLQVLQIANDLSRVLFTFFITNEKRFLKVQDKEQLEELVSDFETQLDIESSNIWVAGAEFEITMIKAVLQSAPSDSEEGKELLISFMSGLVQSVLAMSPTEDLIQTLIDGAKFLYSAYKTENLKKKYEVYYYFESLKWYVIQLLKQNQNVMQLLSDGYKKYIENSNDWLLNFCWVRMISSLISYRPIISKQDLSSNKLESQQMWNQLISRRLLSQLSFDKNSGRLLLFQQDQNRTLNKILFNFGLQQFTLFFNDLLSSLQYSHQKQFQITPKPLNQPNQVDYLFQLFTETSFLDQCVASLNKQSMKIEGQVEQLKKDYQKVKLMQKKDEKLKSQLLQSMEANMRDLTSQYFMSIKLLKNIFLTFKLHFDRFRLTLESINTEGKQQDDETLKLKVAVLQKINTSADNIEVKFKELYLPIEEDKGKATISLVSLQVLFQRQAVQDDQISKHIECLVQFVNQMKAISKYHLDATIELKGICKEHTKYQKNSIKQFTLNNCLNQIETLINNQINKNSFSLQIANYYQIYQTLQNQQSKPFNKLIHYNALKYLFTDLINQLIDFTDTLNDLKYYLEQNKCLLLSFTIIENQNQNNNEIECDDIIKIKLTQQLKIIQQFFYQEEKRINDGKPVEPLSIDQLLQNLRQDAQKLRDLMTDPTNVPQELKSALYAIAAVEQFLIQYVKSPQKLTQIKEQILKIYQKRNVVLLDDQQQQGLQQTIKMLFSQKIENIEFQIDHLIEKVQVGIENSQVILQGSLDNGVFYQNLMNIELQLDFPMDNDEIDVQEYEAHENLYLNDSFAILQELKISFSETNINTEVITLISRSLEIVLFLIDQMQIKSSCSLENDEGALADAKEAIQSLAQDARDSLADQHYKVRQCFVVSLIQIQSSQLEQNLVKFCQDNIVQIWSWEKDERVKALLKNQEIVDMQKSLFSCELKSFSKRLQQEIEERFNIISSLEQKIYLEGDSQIREKLQQQLSQEHSEFEDYLDNINDMTSKLDLSIQYLKDIKKSLAQLKLKIDKLQDTVNNIGEDVRKLRGKNYSELLGIRKRRVMDQMQLRDINQIYIPLKCQEWDPANGKQIANPTILLHDNFQNQAAEINEFLQKDLKVKDVMLLRGVAGSGKSRAAVKIEEFLWQKYESKESQWIPIYVSLPAIKEPKFNLIDQALESDFYQFDKIQIREFKEAIKSEGLKIILILDSYDEMKQDCIQSNLLHTNRLSQDLFGNIKNIKEYFKVIITTRTEVLTSTSYQTWFYGESIESLKEVELLGFDSEQQSRYLLEYTYLSMKREILDLYYFAQQMTGDKIDLEEFGTFWKKIQDYLYRIQNQNQNDFIVTEKQAKPIIAIIKADKCYQKISKDQIVTLEKKFLDLWSANKYEKLIVSAQIQHILTTPFMMEIVVQVLPSMTKKYSDASSFKDQFIQNFITIKQESLQEQNLIQSYQNSKRITQGLQLIIVEEEEEGLNVFLKLANKIWDQLQNEKYFQKFTLVDKIDQSDLSTIDDSSIVIRALIVKKLTVFDFYVTFVEFYHQQQIRKQIELGKAFSVESFIIDLFNFSQSLSINMTVKQQTQIQYNSKGQLNLNFVKKQLNTEDQWLDDYFNDFEQNGDYKKLVRSCILLTKKGGNHTFTHKSIQEFYVGHYLLKMLDEIDLIEEKEFQNICKWENNQLVSFQNKESLSMKLQQMCSNLINSLYNQNQFNLSLDHFKGVISLIKEEMKQQKSLKPKLIQLVKLSQLSDQFTRASSNSIYLLGQTGEYLGNQDFKNIILSDTEVQGLSFYNSNLEGSIFQNVRIGSCNFNCANLKKLNWTDIKCSELPSIIGCEDILNKLVFSPSGQKLMSFSNYILYQNDLKEVKQIKLLEYKQIHNEQDFGQWHYQDFSINQLVFSPDESQIAILWFLSIAYDIGVEIYNSVIQIWDIFSQKSLVCFPLQECKINQIAYSSDGKTFASCNTEKNVQFYDVKALKVIGMFEGHNGPVNSIIFSQDGKVLASGGEDKSIRIINVKDFKQLAILEGHSKSVTKLCLSSNGAILSSSSEDITIRLWNMLTYKPIFIFQGHKLDILGMHFLPDNLIASWGKDQIIIFWDMKEGKQVRCIDRIHKYEYEPVCFSSDGKILALQQEQQIQFWDVKVGKIVTVIERQSKRLQDLVFQPGEQIIFSLSVVKGSIQQWDTQTDKILNTTDGHKKSVNIIVFSPDGKVLVSWSEDNTIRLWNIKEGTQVGKLEGIIGEVDKVEFSEDGQFILIQGLKDNINLVWHYKVEKVVSLEIEKTKKYLITQEFISYKDIWAWWVTYENSETFIQLWNDKERKKISTLGPIKKVDKIQFAFNGSQLIQLLDDESIQIWDIEQRKQISQYKNIESFQVSPNGLILALFNRKKKEVIIIDLIQLNQIIIIPNIENALFSLKNEFLAYALNKNIVLCDVKTGQQLAILEGHVKNVDFQLAFSSNDELLASFSDDKTIRIWDIKQQIQIASLDEESHTSKVVFSPDSRLLATSNVNYNITLWNIRDQKKQFILKGHQTEILFMVFTPDSCSMVSGDEAFNLILWNIVTGQKNTHFTKCEENFEDLSYHAVCFSPDSKLFACFSVSLDGIQIWDIENKKQKALFKGYSKGIKKLNFSEDSLFLTAQVGSLILTFNIKDNKLFDIIENGYKQRKQTKILNDMLIVYGEDNVIKLYDSKQGTIVNQLIGHTHIIDYLIISPDEKYLASACRDCTICLWEVKQWKQNTILLEHLINEIIFSPNGQYLISSSPIQLWNVNTLQQISIIEDLTKQIVFSPDGSKISWTNNLNVKMCETINFKDIVTLNGHKKESNIYCYSTDNKLLITYDKEMLIIWNAISHQQITAYEGYYSSLNRMANQRNIFAFLASQNVSYKIQLFNATNNEKLVFPQEHQDKIVCITFSPNGLILASCSQDGMIKLWDMSKGKGIPQCYKTLANYSPITANQCQISQSQILSIKGQNLKELFLQKGATD